MKVILTILYAVASVVFIGASHYYWTDKTTVQQVSSQSIEEAGSQKKKDEDRAIKEEDKVKEKQEKLLMLTKNWPEKSIARFEQSLQDGTPFNMVIAGSAAVLGQETGWAAQTKAKLLETFGSDTLSVEIKSYESSTRNFINGGQVQELAAIKADMILFEPLIFNNYGNSSNAETLEHLATIIASIKQASPETEFILQPTFPINNSTSHPELVNKLREYAVNNSIKYIDHWSAWPSGGSEDILQYLEADKTTLNPQGHQHWSNLVSEFLISRDSD